MVFENQNLSGYLCTLLFIFVQRFYKACFTGFRERFAIFVNWATVGVLVSGNAKVFCFVRNSPPLVSKLRHMTQSAFLGPVPLRCTSIIFHLCFGFPDGFLSSRSPSAFFTYFYARSQHNCGNRLFGS